MAEIGPLVESALATLCVRLNVNTEAITPTKANKAKDRFFVRGEKGADETLRLFIAEQTFRLSLFSQLNRFYL